MGATSRTPACFKCGATVDIKPLGPAAEPICYTCFMDPSNTKIAMRLPDREGADDG
jgi:NMD protein affecting ribosome stability and mRNA decay